MFGYPYFKPKTPDTTGYESDLLSFWVYLFNWQLNSLHLEMENIPESSTIVNVDKLGGCTYFGTQWARQFYWYADYNSAGEYLIYFYAFDTLTIDGELGKAKKTLR
ncbi:hypothetical protein DRQ33_04835 [bacterium]|nr:MAG: hypothetical protein DRQ33_04835 [bacterium]